MQYTTIPGITKPISRLGQGCMMLKDGDGLAASFAMLDAVFGQGVTCYDHSHVYGGGACERAFGKWLTARGNRDRVVILDKGCHHNGDRKRVTPFDIAHDIADSLARLKVPSIDLWCFHRDDPSQPVGPLIDELNRQRDAGRINAFGASNWTTARLAEAQAFAQAHGLTGFVCTSPNFSLAEQVAEPWPDCLTISGPDHAADRAWLRETGLTAFTWSSLARGFLSGRITRANAEVMRSQVEEHVFRCYATEANFTRLDRLHELAGKKRCTVAQLALAFVLRQDFSTVALVAAYDEAEAIANAAALDIPLTAQEAAWLDLRG